MGDHFVFLVDRLLTESTLEAAIESRNPSKYLVHSDDEETVIDFSSLDDPETGSSPRKIVECRICQDEDVDSKMETPCSCCGSLKYAHRKCIQKWCNEKGDTVCEICHQQFKPGYTAPPPLFRLRGIPVNLRGHWRIARRDLDNAQLITMVSADSDFVDPEFDEYAESTSRSLMCFRTVAVIFMVLLVLRHTLPVIVSGAEQYSFPLFVLLLLRTLGILLPCYVVLRTVTSLIRRRRQQALTASFPPDEEAGLNPLENQPPTIHVQ